jgi:N-carbamoylputrescine amidase
LNNIEGPLSVVAAAIQMASKPFALRENFARAARHIQDACAMGARIVVLPELFHTGYVYDRRLFDYREPIGGQTTRWMQQWSRRREIYLAACLIEKSPAGCHNTLVLTSPCGVVHTYRKRYPAFFEKLYFRPGRGEGIFYTAIGRIGVMVCWDIVQRPLHRELAGRIDMLLICSAWPDMTEANIRLPVVGRWMTKQALEKPRELSRQLGVPVVFANMCGTFQSPLPGLGLTYRSPFTAGSFIADGAGETFQSVERSDEILVASLQLDRVGPITTPQALPPQRRAA